MPRKQFDQTKTVTLNNTNSTTIEIGDGVAGTALVQIDDGTTGNKPATYDLVMRVYNPSEGDYQFYDEVTGVQHRAITDPLFEDKAEYELTNQSGGQATYRIRALGLQEA